VRGVVELGKRGCVEAWGEWRMGVVDMNGKAGDLEMRLEEWRMENGIWRALRARRDGKAREGKGRHKICS